ncbi:hypothetical protein ABGF25_04365 [Helcococcus ovis]
MSLIIFKEIIKKDIMYKLTISKIFIRLLLSILFSGLIGLEIEKIIVVQD